MTKSDTEVRKQMPKADTPPEETFDLGAVNGGAQDLFCQNDAETWGVAVQAPGRASVAQSRPVGLEMEDGSSLAAGYHRVEAADDGFLGTTEISGPDGSRFRVEDLWCVEGGTLALDRRLRVEGSADAGFLSAFVFRPGASFVWPDVDPFAPGLLYGNVGGDAGSLPDAAIGSLGHWLRGVREVRIREDRFPAPLFALVGYPVQDSMINDNAGLILGPSQYAAFERGMWSREPYELFAIFEALNEPADHGLPREAMSWAEFGGLCDKLMIVHPGKFCSPHLHWRKTEFYEVVLGEMDLFYAPQIIEDESLGIRKAGLIEPHPMPKGGPWPGYVRLPEGREATATYGELTEYRRLEKGDPKFVLHRKHLHAFGCPPDARTPVVIREGSAYSHEPTETVENILLPEWRHIHDNAFLLPEINAGRLANNIREAQ